MAKNRYRADLRINKHRLDDELLEQPQKYYDWSQAAAEAEVERDDAKDDYDLVLIDIEDDIRSNPDKYFDSDRNITEGAIKSALNSHRKVKRYRRKFTKARANFNLLKKAEKAFEQRKRMLEAYLYYRNKNMDGEVKVPINEQRRMSEDTRKDIESQLKGTYRPSGSLRRRRKR
jgi:hypothetical protein